MPGTLLQQLNKSDTVLAFTELIDQQERGSTSERDVDEGRILGAMEEAKIKQEN